MRLGFAVRLGNIKTSLRYKKPGIPLPQLQAARQKGKNLWLANAGLLLFIFGACYLMVPLYKLFCQKVGLEGDTTKKDYSRLSQLNKMRKFRVRFEAEVDPELAWEFAPMQPDVQVHAGETSLAFYTVTNNSSKPVIGTAIYAVYPEFASNYFSKIQCFCFNQQMIAGKETVDLPVYFYLDPLIASDPLLENLKDVIISYKFFPSKNQKLAELVYQRDLHETSQKVFLLRKKIDLFSQENSHAGLEEISALRVELKDAEETLQRLTEHDPHETPV